LQLVVLVCVLGGLVGEAPVFADQAETPDEQAKRAQDLNRTVMSPFCPGRTLEGCPSPSAKQWRDDIREWVAQGLSSDEIRRRLYQRTEQDLTGSPSTALDSVLPFIVTLAALVLLVLLLRKLVKPTPVAEGSSRKAGEPATNPQDLDARLDEELRNMDD